MNDITILGVANPELTITSETTATINIVAGAVGVNGLSAYGVAVAEGFVGDEAAWLASLVGATGAAGATGATGPAGATGETGPAGADGAGADSAPFAFMVMGA